MRRERGIDGAIEAKLERVQQVMRAEFEKQAEGDPTRLVLAMLKVLLRRRKRPDAGPPGGRAKTLPVIPAKAGIQSGRRQRRPRRRERRGRP